MHIEKESFYSAVIHDHTLAMGKKNKSMCVVYIGILMSIIFWKKFIVCAIKLLVF